MSDDAAIDERTLQTTTDMQWVNSIPPLMTTRGDRKGREAF